MAKTTQHRLGVLVLFALSVMVFTPSRSSAQATAPDGRSQSQAPSQLDVNWLYGAYVPKDAPLQPLTAQERWRLYLRQSFTTPGIYVKTAIFSVGDQINDSPPSWGTGLRGYARRISSRQGQFVIQNSFTALGNGLLGFEPRYNRCRCSGFWSRTRHAIARNFVTYDRTEKALRPQIALYAGAFGAGVVEGTWKPSNRNLLDEGYRSAITQVAFGIAANWVGEFAPDIKRMLRKKKTLSSRPQSLAFAKTRSPQPAAKSTTDRFGGRYSPAIASSGGNIRVASVPLYRDEL